MAQTFFEIEIGEELVEVCFTGSPKWENNGIGSYEYWGSKEYDKGVDYVTMEDSEIEWERKEYSEAENAAIEQWLEDNDNCTAVQDALCDDFEKDCNDY